MPRAEEIVKTTTRHKKTSLNNSTFLFKDRLETIHSLDADILDTLEDEKAIEEEIKEAGVFSEMVL